MREPWHLLLNVRQMIETAGSVAARSAPASFSRQMTDRRIDACWAFGVAVVTLPGGRFFRPILLKACHFRCDGPLVFYPTWREALSDWMEEGDRAFRAAFSI